VLSGEEGHVRLEAVNDGVLDALVEEFGGRLRGASLVLAGATSAGVGRFLDAGGVGLRRLVLTADDELDLSAVDWSHAAPELADLQLTRTRVGPSVLAARSLEQLVLRQCVVSAAEPELDLDAKLPQLRQIDLVDTAIGVRRLVVGEAGRTESVDISYKLPAGPWFEELVFVSCRSLWRCKVTTSKAPWRARFSGDFPKLTAIKFSGPRGRHAVDVSEVRDGGLLVREASLLPGASAGDPVQELSQLGYAVTKTEGRYRIAPQIEDQREKLVSDLPGAARLERLGGVEALSLGSYRLRDVELRKLLGFAGAERLRSFTVDLSRFRDASPIAACAALEELTLISAELEDPSPLAALPKLAALTLRLSKNRLDLTSLPRFPALRRLDLTDSTAVDHAPLLDCARLEKLEVGVARYHDAPEVFETLRRRGVEVEPLQQAASDYQEWLDQSAGEAKKRRPAKRRR
jgi:hypothetical protein